MHILALEPYFGGSHLAFLEGWQKHSQHRWTTLTLPPHHWKWRMRHAAVTFAEQANRLVEEGQCFDLIFATDMMNLGEFIGLAAESIRRLPCAMYFHENQLTYPDRRRGERDHHFAVTNFVSMLAADQVWFNSAYHRDEFFLAAGHLLAQMPDYPLTDRLDALQRHCLVCHPGIEDPPESTSKLRGVPVHLIWAARWEHDKNPDLLLSTLELMESQNVDYRLSVIGESFREVPPAILAIRARFTDRIVHWGYQPSRDAYWRALAEADVFISTADHEFFGIAAVEACAAGCYPLLPRRLAYPEVMKVASHSDREQYFYDGTAENLAAKITAFANRRGSPSGDSEMLIENTERFRWRHLAPKYDALLTTLTGTGDDPSVAGK